MKKYSRKIIKSKQTSKKISGWLLLILGICFYSALFASNLLFQRINWIFNANAVTGFGVYISAILLIFYCIAIFTTIVFILMKKKLAIKMFIISGIFETLFTIWFYLIGQLIYFPEKASLIWKYNSIVVIINLAIILGIMFYLLKSKRVKETLVR